ncbi:MAG: hypothetical protein ACHQF0_08155 [Chitinophagales bacterium]
MIPISYNGFGPTAILLMLICLMVSQGYKYYKHRKAIHKKVVE